MSRPELPPPAGNVPQTSANARAGNTFDAGDTRDVHVRELLESLMGVRSNVLVAAPIQTAAALLIEILGPSASFVEIPPSVDVAADLLRLMTVIKDLGRSAPSVLHTIQLAMVVRHLQDALDETPEGQSGRFGAREADGSLDAE